MPGKLLVRPPKLVILVITEQKIILKLKYQYLINNNLK